MAEAPRTELASLLRRYAGHSEETAQNVARSLAKIPPDEIIAAYRNGEAPTGPVLDRLPAALDEIWKEWLHDFLNPDPFLVRPSWAGMGRELDRMTGGGFSPGQIVGLGAMGAGIGKTAFGQQLAEGIAEWSAGQWARSLETSQAHDVVPVVIVSEMGTRDLTLRSLARQSGVEGYILRDPKGTRGSRPLTSEITEGDSALDRARVAAETFCDAAKFIYPIDRHEQVSVGAMVSLVEGIREAWESRGARVPAVLLFIDPIHRIVDRAASEVEALRLGMLALLDVTHRTGAIGLFTSDTTKLSALNRAEAGSKQRGDDLAREAEAAFGGSYKLLHTPDVALGLITLRPDDEHLPADVSERLRQEPEGTLYAELVNAKSRWDASGRRAAFLFDPALFRFRPTVTRELQGDRPLRDRILEFVAANPGCSENAVRKAVAGSDRAIRSEIQTLLGDQLFDSGTGTTGRRLQIVENPSRTKAEQPSDVNSADSGAEIHV